MQSILTESDVEQKFIIPLLTNKYPDGLGYSMSDFQTKINIRKLEIDKGNSKKVYFPDYIVVSNGYPIIIIEAKAPEEDISEGFREARLYAHELNANYPTNVNPCKIVITTNYKQTYFGYWDSSDISLSFNSEDITLANKNYHEFISQTRKDRIETISKELLMQERGRRNYKKPIFLFNGLASPGEMIGDNSFGSNISIDYGSIFNPSTLEERKNVVNNAYVNSRKRMSHIDPINKIIRNSGFVGTEEITSINETEKPIEINNVLKDIDRYKKHVFILVGSVGSGKSTFIDYLRFIALDENIKKKTFWITLNMNNAPESKELIYNWVINESINQIKENIEDDFDSYETLKCIFHNEINKFNKGPISLFDKESDKYRTELYKLIQSLQENINTFFNTLLRYYFAEKGILPVIVLDNSDKRDRDLQLLMFDVANWLKATFTCMVFLPLRDTTFDQYKHTPPLDTVVKDLMFRIDPPLLDKVLQLRYEYVLRELPLDNNTFHYSLRNGMRVECKREEIGGYLKAILKALFTNDLVKRMFLGIAGRDIRKGIEFFLDFCKSGYIIEDTILRIQQSNGDYLIPTYVAMQIILKGSRRFYNDEDSRVKNIYKMYKEDDYPNPFVRCTILNWLQENQKYNNEHNYGYFNVEDIKKDLITIGLSEDRINKEIYNLLLADCIINDKQKYELPQENDLFAITPCGTVHLELLTNVYYLSFIAEDTFFSEEDKARKVTDNLLNRSNFPFMNYQSILENAKILVDYLFEYYKKSNFACEKYIDTINMHDYVGINKLKQWIDNRLLNDEHYIDYEMLENQYPSGSIYDATIIHVMSTGVFVEFGLSGKGYIHFDIAPSRLYEKDEAVKIKIVQYNRYHNNFNVEMVEEFQES